MRTFSRWMPKRLVYETGGIPDVLILALPLMVVSMFLWLIYAFFSLFLKHPLPLIAVAGVVGLFCAGMVHHKRRWRRMAASRKGESICTFVRAFDCRNTDTWILRAVYEELIAICATVDGRAFPIRPEDRWEDDLEIDSEDMEDLIQDIARRAGRSLENLELNPLYGKAKTVRDIVSFLQHQPKAESARESRKSFTVYG